MALRKSLFAVAFVFLVLHVMPSAKSLAKDKELTPDELIAAHLKSIGSPEVLKQVKSRAINGSTSVIFRLGAEGHLTGQSQVVSEGHNLGLVMKYGALAYPEEHFAFDGKDVTVAYINHGQRSPLGNFINQFGNLMREGLLGGTLSVGWSLLEVQERSPKLKYSKRKVEGRELHVLNYRPAKGLGGIEAYLFFDPETYRHVRSEYRLRITSGMGQTAGRTGTGRETSDSIYLLSEQFDDFKQVDGMMLPHAYAIDFSVEGPGNTFLARWTIEAKEWVHNGKIDPQIFTAK